MSCEYFVQCEMCGRFDRFISAERRIRLLPARCKEEWINFALLHVLFVFASNQEYEFVISLLQDKKKSSEKITRPFL